MNLEDIKAGDEITIFGKVLKVDPNCGFANIHMQVPSLDHPWFIPNIAVATVTRPAPPPIFEGGRVERLPFKSLECWRGPIYGTVLRLKNSYAIVEWDDDNDAPYQPIANLKAVPSSDTPANQL